MKKVNALRSNRKRTVSPSSWLILLTGMALVVTTPLPGPCAPESFNSSVEDSLVSSAEDSLTAGTNSSAGKLDGLGEINGVVRSAENGEPMPYTNVLIYRHPQPGRPPEFVGGTLAITEGRFFSRLKPGRYDLVFQYIGRERATVEDIDVTAGERSELETSLKIKPIMMENGIQGISAPRLATSENAALQRQRKAAAVQDALTKEQVDRTGDSNAAAAVARVSGVSVVGGKYVYVRGLGDRYSATLLNGSELGSPEPNKRTIPMDVFPTAVFDQIVIQKTYTPDMNGEFGGGIINIASSDYVGKTKFSHTFSMGANSNAMQRKFLTYHGGGRDWLGHDDGTRAIPDPVLDATRDANLIFGSYTQQELVDLRRSFSNVWQPYGREYTPDYGYTGSFATGARFLGADWGVLASLTQKNSGESNDRHEILQEGGGSIRTDYQVAESTRNTLGGATGSLTMHAGESNSAKLNFLYTSSSDDIARILTGPNNNWSVEDTRQYQLAWIERTMKSAVLSGKHENVFGTELGWKGAYSEALRSEPDRRQVIYEAKTVDAPLTLSSRSQYPYTRVYGESLEDARSASADWRVPITTANSFSLAFKTGYAWWNRDRGTAYRRFGYKCRSFNCRLKQELFTLSPEQILDSQDLTDDWVVEETTRDDDAYEGTHEVNARYLMADIKLSKKFRIVSGVRWEDSRQNVSTWKDDAQPGKSVTLSVDKRNRDPLPSLNATWSITPKMNLRGTFSRTVNRPQLRELTPLKVYNFNTGWYTTGNPELGEAKIEAYDLRWEYFPAFRQYVSFSLFYKDLFNPIELAVVPDVGNYNEKPVNADRGKLRGAEIELRSSFGGLWKLITLQRSRNLLPSHSLSDRFSMVFNYSRVESEAVTSFELGTGRARPLTGQANYSLNIGLFYDSRRQSMALLWRDFGKRLSGLGLGTLPDVYEEPPASMDFRWRWQVGAGFALQLSTKNLLDRTVNFTQGDKIVRSWTPGREFGLAFGWSL